MRFELGGGVLVCAPDARIVVHMPEYLGQAFGIDEAGRLRWTYVVDSFVPPVRVRVASGTRLDLDEAFGFANRVASGALLGDGLTQFVIQRSYARDTGRDPEFSALLLSISDGRLRSRPLAPPIFGASSTTLALEHIEDPYPAVRIWRKHGR
jgi:hypothetical protein